MTPWTTEEPRRRWYFKEKDLFHFLLKRRNITSCVRKRCCWGWRAVLFCLASQFPVQINGFENDQRGAAKISTSGHWSLTCRYYSLCLLLRLVSVRTQRSILRLSACLNSVYGVWSETFKLYRTDWKAEADWTRRIYSGRYQSLQLHLTIADKNEHEFQSRSWNPSKHWRGPSKFEVELTRTGELAGDAHLPEPPSDPYEAEWEHLVFTWIWKANYKLQGVELFTAELNLAS